MERLLLGPLDFEDRFFLRDASDGKNISTAVAQFMGLPESMLNSFLQKLDDEQRMEREKIVVKFVFLLY